MDIRNGRKEREGERERERESREFRAINMMMIFSGILYTENRYY